MDNKFSVLISTYAGDNPAYLEEALHSVTTQTINPSEVVIVKDGPLTPDLDNVIDKYCRKFNGMFKIIASPINKGLGPALSEGLLHCSHDIVARMDADDIAKPERFESQLNILINDRSIDVVGSWVDEFYGSTENVISVKKVPETTEEIKEYAKKRNPLNHPTVMYRKKAVIDAGSYGSFHLMEDYILWAAMLKNGSKMYNIQKSLLYYRADENMFKRRGGISYIKSDIILQRKLLELGLINPMRFILNILIRSLVRITPNNIRAFIYRLFLRSKL